MRSREFIFLLGISALIFFSSFIILLWYEDNKDSRQSPSDQKIDNRKANIEIREDKNSGSKIRVLSDEESKNLIPAVHYQSGEFVPREITARDQGGGCLIAIYNDDFEDILVRLSPHNEAGDPGFAYDLVKPQTSIKIDPRYTGLDEVIFHDHLNPAAEFKTTFDNTCK